MYSYCDKCGAVIPENAHYCMMCGAERKEERAETSREQTLNTLNNLGNQPRCNSTQGSNAMPFNTTTLGGNNIIALIMQYVGIGVAAIGLVISIILAAQAYSGGFVIFLTGAVSSVLGGLLFFATGEVIALLHKLTGGR